MSVPALSACRLVEVLARLAVEPGVVGPRPLETRYLEKLREVWLSNLPAVELVQVREDSAVPGLKRVASQQVDLTRPGGCWMRLSHFRLHLMERIHLSRVRAMLGGCPGYRGGRFFWP